MNAELYMLRNMNKSRLSNAEINNVAAALKEKSINIIYKTELDSDEDKIIECIAQSLKSEEKIDYIIIPSGFQMKGVNTVIYKTLSHLSNKGNNRLKNRLQEQTGELTGTFKGATEIDGNGLRKGYYFVISGVKIILLPVIEKSGLKSLVLNSIKFVEEGDKPKIQKLEDEIDTLEDSKTIDQILEDVENELEKLSREEDEKIKEIEEIEEKIKKKHIPTASMLELDEQDEIIIPKKKHRKKSANNSVEFYINDDDDDCVSFIPYGHHRKRRRKNKKTDDKTKIESEESVIESNTYSDKEIIFGFAVDEAENISDNNLDSNDENIEIEHNIDESESVSDKYADSNSYFDNNSSSEIEDIIKDDVGKSESEVFEISEIDENSQEINNNKESTEIDEIENVIKNSIQESKIEIPKVSETNKNNKKNYVKKSVPEVDEDGITVIDDVLEEKSVEEKKVNSFKERFVPLKNDSGKEKVRKVVLDLAIIVFVVTASILVKVLVIDPFINNMKYNEIRQMVKSDEVEISTEITTDPQGNKVVRQVKKSKNWDELKKINSDVIGWVSIDDTNIDYPVLQHEGDTIDYQYYLYKDIYKNYSGYGSIFADFRSNKAGDSKNIILHGHHMNDGSMFQNLMNYGKYSIDLDYYKEHPVINFDTPNGDETYKIISIFKTSTLDQHGEFFDYLVGSFQSDAEFMNYVYLVRERSLVDTGVTCNEDDQLLTLSTCSYEYSDFRTVVVARKTRTGENMKVDTSKAKANPDPLWPDVYYNNNGGTKPKVTTFKTASKVGEIDWYDGEGNLKGKERMFTLHDEYLEDATENASGATETNTEPTEPTEPPVITNESILFDYSTLVMNIGDTETLKVYWTPDNTTDKSLKLESSNGNVATISSDGTVRAKSPGECIITAESSNGNKTVCNIIVNDILATKLTLSPSTYSTDKLGEVFNLKAVVEPSNHSNDITWSTSDNRIASVSNTGVVTIKGYGSCTVSAKIDSLTVSCKITVNQPATESVTEN